MLYPFRRMNNQSALVLIALMLLMTGCSSRQPKLDLDEQKQKLAEQLSNGGYLSTRKYSITSNHTVWQHAGAEFDVVISAPDNAGKFPLIIYLPSLGETASAGQIWREAWAKTGYVVLSVQPVAIGQALQELKQERDTARREHPDAVDENEDAGEEKSWFFSKSKPVNNNGAASELRYLGHEYFAIDKLKNRIEQLDWLYQHFKQHAAQTPAIANAIDFSKVILAGYDLGAQTVAAIIGEDFKTSLPKITAFSPYAAILLSPSIDLAEGNIKNRFQNINIPMLVITGNDDYDPYAISSAPVRSAIWEYAPAGSKYLLRLTGKLHTLLSGNDFGGGIGRIDSRASEAETTPKSPDSKLFANQYGAGNREHNSQQGFSDFGISQRDKDERKAKLRYKLVAAVLSATGAFLDAESKNDEFAHFWIQGKAVTWLTDVGTFTVR